MRKEKKINFPAIMYKGVIHFEIGCQLCGAGGQWRLYTEGKKMLASCECGNVVEIPDVKYQSKPKSLLTKKKVKKVAKK